MNPMDWSNVFENQESNIELVLEKDKDPVKVMEDGGDTTPVSGTIKWLGHVILLFGRS